MQTTLRLSWNNIFAIYQQERGVVLTTSLILLAVLSLMGATAILTTITDTQIASNLKVSLQALYDAEAGANYALTKVPNLIADGSLSLSGTLATETLTTPITAPSDFSFDPIATFTQVLGTTKYQFQVTGHAGTASATLDVVFDRESPFPYGFFGNKQVALQAESKIYSSNSAIISGTVPTSSTGEGSAGSNEDDQVDATAFVDGKMILGQDEIGNPGSYTVTGDPTQTPEVVNGWPPAAVGRVEPDPLGVLAGSIADNITFYSSSNDNIINANPPISDDVINLGNRKDLTLTAGNYYLESITLHGGSHLHIDTSAGPVNLYLVGPFDAQRGSTITYASTTSTSLTDVNIFSNSSSPISFKHNGVFKGLVYAPNASVELDNRAPVGLTLVPFGFGLIWSEAATLGNSGQFYFDTALKDKFLSNHVSIVAWKENWE